jgi:eukaryotic-like serine/threonine-protein kinase
MADSPQRETISAGGTLPPGETSPAILADRYSLQHELGRGGMGRVFAALDERLERRVAVKLLAPGARSAEVLARFEQEARAAGALNHPNVLTVFDSGVHEGTPFIVTELLEGETLRARLTAGSPGIGVAVDIALQIARGLAAAHEKGIIHRDLKPENVFLTRDGRAKILDFGIAKLTADGKASLQTAEGTLLGTLAYMSPEQLRGERADARSDIFSLGVILYEMLCGHLPFADDSSALAGALAAVTGEIRPMGTVIPTWLQSVVRRCLAKEPGGRFASAAELAGALERHPVAISRAWKTAIAVVAAVALAAGAGWIWRSRARSREAEAAIPRLVQLVEKGDYSSAYALGLEVEKIIPHDPVLLRLWPEMSQLIAVETDPPDADVYVREYGARDAAFKHLGRSPLPMTRLPLAMLRWRVVKDGFQPLEQLASAKEGWPVPPLASYRIATLHFVLDKAGSAPQGMVRVRGGRVSMGTARLNELPAVELPDFFIDRTEVSNAEFKKFVDAGGYRRRELWQIGFQEQGRSLSWEEAMARFVDRTGRPGPATWESGAPPDGQADLPVTGVSWYEAAAYAAFAGKRLPTLHHWTRAAGLWAAEVIVPFSNFSQRGLLPAGPERGFSVFGAFDMAGNAKEWCWNAMGDRRYIMGGAWDEADYGFTEPDAQPPMDRKATWGFRLMSSPPVILAEAEVVPSGRDYRKETPVSDEVFTGYRKLYAYDPAALNPSLDAVDDSDPRWRMETVSFAAAYGNERVPGYLFIPRAGSPPWQTVVFFPNGAAMERGASIASQIFRFDSYVKSGRALFLPIYKGTFQRYDDLENIPYSSPAYRAHVIAWSNDLGRSIDYLQSRPDIDAAKIAFASSSWGGRLGPLLLALEPRIKAAVLVAGGLTLASLPPEVDPFNFAPRVRQPVLMINGRLDWSRPLETSQLPLLHTLGTPEADKRHVLAETGHFAPRELVARESLAWLDRYLGPVR